MMIIIPLVLLEEQKTFRPQDNIYHFRCFACKNKRKKDVKTFESTGKDTVQKLFCFQSQNRLLQHQKWYE